MHNNVLVSTLSARCMMKETVETWSEPERVSDHLQVSLDDDCKYWISSMNILQRRSSLLTHSVLLIALSVQSRAGGFEPHLFD